jgi:predicted ATPase
MKIRKLEIDNLRGLSHVECDFDKPINVIVGPNAIGKTTILEAVRLTKALLMPRYFQEGQQVLVALGATSPHAQLSNYIDFGALARDSSQPTKISISLELNEKEIEYVKLVRGQLTLELLRGQLARNDEQGQLVMAQYLSSAEGQSRLAVMAKEVEEKFDAMRAPYNLAIKLTIDGARGQIGGSEPFNQSLVTILERRCPPHLALMSYFPADRAFPTGEANVQIGSGEASNQIQSHIGLAANKYQRLKQTIVNNLMLAGLDRSKLEQDFQEVLGKLLPGKALAGLSVTPVGTLKVAIREIASGKVFDIDSMSSGEKGLILTFMLLRRSLDSGGIALLDEPELHLNPAVCKNIVPFLNETIIADSDLQILLCTHSAEILGAAFDSPDCSIHHLRSHKDATKIYKRDSREVFDALRRLGTTAAESLFARGNIFVEGEHDSAILEEGFYDQVIGYRITSLGGRKEVEKEITTLQLAEQKGELDKLSCFIFDLDGSPTGIRSSEQVHVLQWDRYCLENYLINRKLLFDELTDAGVEDLGSRGGFEQRVVELALSQLNGVVAKNVYAALEPDNPGMRPSETDRKSFSEIATVLAGRLQTIRSDLNAFDEESWKIQFVALCTRAHAELEVQWKEQWLKLCSGKRLIDDIYREYTVRGLSKFDFKRRLAKRMKSEQTEDWTLVKSKIRDALGV